MGLFSADRGMNCQPEEDGSYVCRPYQVKKGEKLATGTEVRIAVDPSTCKRVVTGGFDIMDKDEQAVDKIAKKLELSCRKGL